jgi:hypothetical protein
VVVAVIVEVNWKRGFLRLWVIVSLLWLVVVTGFAFLAASKQEERIRQSAPAEIAECEFCEFPAVEYETVWRMPPWWVLVVAAGVPLLLLAVGVAGYWVARGFKRSNWDATAGCGNAGAGLFCSQTRACWTRSRRRER